MGAACCVAAKDRTIVSRPRAETLQRHVRYSPSWSFRRENRGRVAGEETSINWLRDGDCGNDRADLRSSTTGEAVFASEQGSPLDSIGSLSGQKSAVSRGNSDQAISGNLVEVKESTEPPSISLPYPVKPSPSAPSVPLMSSSPPSSRNQLLPLKSTPSRWHQHSPAHHLLKLSDSPIPEHKYRTFSISEESYELTPGSNGGSSGSWSIPLFSEHITSRRERWSFDSENSGLNKIAASSGQNLSPSIDLQICGICTKLLTERSSWGFNSQKIISTNELGVVSVLTCGHVYHAECLENMTPEINKYDPACPVCTYGQKRTVKMSEKALKTEMGSKAKKRSKKHVSSDLSGDIMFDRRKSSGAAGRGPAMSSSSSMNSPRRKHFLKQNFSFGSKDSKSLSENQSTRRKGLFWARTSKG